MSKSILSVGALSIKFDNHADKPVVRDVNFKLGAGERLAIIGESGSGKTLTALSVLNLLPQGARVEGKVQFADTDMLRLSATELARLRGAKIGIVFQDALSSFNPLRTIGSVICESAIRHRKLTRHEARQQAIALMEELGVPEASKRIDAYPHQLSGGLRQRCMIALALINDPELLIADEPTTALDATIQAQILALLKARSAGKSLIFITHDLAAAARLCDRALLMRHGEIIEIGRLPDMLNDPKSAYGRELVAASPALSKHIVNRDSQTKSDNAAALSACNVSKSYKVKGGLLHALRNVSIDLYQGETVAIVGESGCGKSTLAKTLIGLISPDSGSLLLNGEELKNTAEGRSKLRKHAQFVFQDPYASLDPNWSVIRSVAEPLTVAGVPSNEARTVAAEVLEAVGIDKPMFNRAPRAFSGGQRQRIAIARALVTKPDLLIADEPLSALDMTIQKQIVDILQELKKQRGIGLAMVSHDIDLVGEIADRIIVMYLGQIVEAGDAQGVIEKPRHHYTAALVAASSGHLTVKGDPPSPMKDVPGCPFASRCNAADETCQTQKPSFTTDSDGRSYACWHPRNPLSN